MNIIHCYGFLITLVAICESSGGNLLDGCHHVYLDLGTHIGIQIRKIYEPHLFPVSPVLPVLEKYFGTSRSSVCSVGFEPNPAFTGKLVNLESHYNSCGLNVTINTESGVTGKLSGTEKIKFQHGSDSMTGRLVRDPQEGNTVDVATVRISDYINNVVGTRRLPTDKESLPKVVIKLDVEGLELEIIPDLVMNGALKHVDLIMVDYHYLPIHSSWVDTVRVSQMNDAISSLVKLAKDQGIPHVTEIVEFDDETYGYGWEAELTKCIEMINTPILKEL